MLTHKTKYALKALIALAEEQGETTPPPEGDPTAPRGGDATAAGGSAPRRSALRKSGALRIDEIAERGNVPRRFLEHILLDLKRGGVIASRRGRNGGYELIKPPETIGLGTLIRQIDGPIAPLPCLSRHAYQKCEDCADEATCRIRQVFGGLFWSYLLLIESLTLADLLEDAGAVDRLADMTPS